MLNYSEIADKITHPNTIHLGDLEDLKKLTETFPYAAVFSQLYLKGLATCNAIKFDTELENFAYKVPDRARLFYLVDEVAKSEPIASEKDKVGTVSDGNQEKTLETPLVREIANKHDINTVDDKVAVRSTEEQAIETVEEVKADTKAPENDKTEEIKNRKEGEFNDLEKEILAHAVSSSIMLEVAEEEEEEISFSDLRKLDESNNDTIEELPNFELDLGTTLNEESSIQTFTAWMDYGDTFEEEEKEKIQFLNEQAHENVETVEKNKNIFTENKPIKPFFSPVQKAKESLYESTLPVSETLAKIYVAQGNYPKGIEAYQKLMLKFPEKKTYFALQIEILKKKL